MSDLDDLKRIFEVEIPTCVRNDDVLGYLALWSENCWWCPANAPDEIGKPAIQGALTKLLDQYSINATFTADEIVICADYGYVNGTSVEKLTPRAGGETTIAHSREFWLFVRNSETWQIARMIFNLKPPLTP